MNWRIIAFCVLGGLPFSVAGFADGTAGWWWLAGMLIGASFVPCVQFGPAHILEIMTQNVSLGMTAVWLLRRKAY
jgi:hypothetical protein